jgi:hypothetical protein
MFNICQINIQIENLSRDLNSISNQSQLQDHHFLPTAASGATAIQRVIVISIEVT